MGQHAWQALEIGRLWSISTDCIMRSMKHLQWPDISAPLAILRGFHAVEAAWCTTVLQPPVATPARVAPAG